MNLRHSFQPNTVLQNNRYASMRSTGEPGANLRRSYESERIDRIMTKVYGPSKIPLKDLKSNADLNFMTNRIDNILGSEQLTKSGTLPTIQSYKR